MPVECTCFARSFDRHAASTLRSAYGSRDADTDRAPSEPCVGPVLETGRRDNICLGSSGTLDSFDEQLRMVCLRAVARFDRGDLIVHLNLVLDGVCPLDHREAVLRAASEMVGNAIEHGFYQRRQGRIDLWLTRADAPDTRLDVSDDGWGVHSNKVTEGRGFRLLHSLGKVSLYARAENTGRQMTTVSLVIPPLCSAG